MKPRITAKDCKLANDTSAGRVAKQNLILTSIRLFAEHGVDAVPLRLINREAGHKNNSALHYHFGSKLKLIAAVDQFIQDHFDLTRESSLSELERRAESEAIAVREILEVFVSPYVVIIESYDWGYEAIRTIARMEFDTNPAVHALLSRSAGVVVQRFAKLSRYALPEMTARECKIRFNFVSNVIIRGFADYKNLGCSYLGDLSFGSLNELAAFHVDMGSAALTFHRGDTR